MKSTPVAGRRAALSSLVGGLAATLPVAHPRAQTAQTAPTAAWPVRPITLLVGRGSTS